MFNKLYIYPVNWDAISFGFLKYFYKLNLHSHIVKEQFQTGAFSYLQEKIFVNKFFPLIFAPNNAKSKYIQHLVANNRNYCAMKWCMYWKINERPGTKRRGFFM